MIQSSVDQTVVSTGGTAPMPAPRHGRRPVLRTLVLVAGSLFMVFPLIWLVSASLKPDSEIFSNPMALFSTVTFENYVQAWTSSGRPFWVYLANSLLVAVVACVGNVIACSMAGYVFARLRFPLRGAAFAMMIATLLIPHQVTVIPQFTIFRAFGWIDTYLPLVVPKFFAVDAFFVFLITQFIRSLPKELDEAARIDGCGSIRIYLRVILPLLTPALVSTAIFTFIWTYDDFFGQLIYINSPAKFTVPLALRMYIDATGTSSYGQMLAMSVVALAPVVAFFIVFQRRIVEGVATSGLKG